MKPRALAIDLDGTLLSADEQVSPRNRAAIRAAREAGVAVIIATARWYQQAQRVADTLQLTGPVIACSGAEVRRLPGGSDLWDVRMPLEFSEELFRICDAAPCVVYAALDEAVLLKLEGDADTTGFPELRRVESLRDAADAPARVIMVHGRRIRARALEELGPAWADRVRFVTSITTQGHELLTLTAQGADKGLALKCACDDLGISPAEVVAFGDADNDVELFAAAGASFAMGNATAAAKAAATAVTAPNTEDGVAQAIDRLLSEGIPT